MLDKGFCPYHPLKREPMESTSDNDLDDSYYLSKMYPSSFLFCSSGEGWHSYSTSNPFYGISSSRGIVHSRAKGNTKERVRGLYSINKSQGQERKKTKEWWRKRMAGVEEHRKKEGGNSCYFTQKWLLIKRILPPSSTTLSRGVFF